MQMEDGDKVISKIEKGYELVTKARNLRLHLKGETLRHEHAFTILKSIVHKSYYIGHQHEFMGLTKPEVDKKLCISHPYNGGGPRFCTQKRTHLQ